MAKKATLPKLLDQQFVVDRDGKRQAVIVPLKDYEQLMEDLHDLAVVAERRDEEPISLDDMKRRLRGICLPSKAPSVRFEEIGV